MGCVLSMCLFDGRWWSTLGWHFSRHWWRIRQLLKHVQINYLYVLEQAFASTHPESGSLFAQVLNASGHHAISMYKAPIISAPTFIHKSCCRSMWENSRDIQHAPIFVRGRLSARERHDEYLPIVGVALFFLAGNLHFLNGSIADRLQIWSLNYRSMFSTLRD